jgi:hypothetical protein
MPIGKISKNERLLGEGSDAMRGVDAAWDRKVVSEVESFYRNLQKKLQIKAIKLLIESKLILVKIMKIAF